MITKGVIAILILWAYACIRALLNPWIGFLGYVVFVVLCPRWNWRWGWVDYVDYQKFLAGATLIGVILTGALSKQIPRPAKTSLWFFTLFLGWVWLSSFNTLSEYYTNRFWDNIWKIWLMASLGLFLIDDEKKLRWFVWALILSQGWNAYNINQLYYQYGINVRYFEWNYLDNNTYSIATTPLIGLAVSMLLVLPGLKTQIASGLVFVLSMHVIMILKSRGTMMGGLALAVFAILFMPKSRRAIQMTLIGFICASVLAGPSVVDEFMSSFNKEENLDNSAASRFKLWKAGAGIIADNPLLGVGPWSGQFIVPAYYEGDLGGMEQKALHNLFFEIGTGSGVPALVFYLAYFFIPWLAHLSLWLKGIPEPGSWGQAINLAALCGIPGYWVSSMFSSGALIEPPYLLVTLCCVGLTFSGYREDGQYHLESTDNEGEEFEDYGGPEDDPGLLDTEEASLHAGDRFEKEFRYK